MTHTISAHTMVLLPRHIHPYYGVFHGRRYWLIGHHDGIEARAINNCRNHAKQNNYGDGIDYWSPTVNMQRDPRWGRNQEVPGTCNLLHPEPLTTAIGINPQSRPTTTM